MRSSPTTTPVSITGWTRACLFSPRRCPADVLPSLNDLGTCGPNASVEELRMIDLTRALALIEQRRAAPGTEASGRSCCRVLEASDASSALWHAGVLAPAADIGRIGG